MTEKINPDKAFAAIQEAWARYYQRILEVEETECIDGSGLHVDESALAHLHKAAKRLWSLNSRQGGGET